MPNGLADVFVLSELPDKGGRQSRISPNRYVLRLFLGILTVYVTWMVAWRATDRK